MRKHLAPVGISRIKLGVVFAAIAIISSIAVSIAIATYHKNTLENGTTAAPNAQAGLLSSTDKTEMPTESLVAPPPVPDEVTAAERQMAKAVASTYNDACHNLKAMYTTERDRNLQVENDTHKANQQDIINKFSKEGLSFSSTHKSTQSKELNRHNGLLDQIGKQYTQQLKSLSC